MVAFADLFVLPTRKSIKDGIVSIAQSAGLKVTSWVLGEPSERWIEISARAIDQFLSNITTQSVRMFFLELATDPGDPGDLSADQTPRPGFLSALGAGWYGVVRGSATYGRGFVTITNAGSTPATFKPFDLTLQRSTAGPDGGNPTYRNSADPSIYTGIGGTLTLAPGASATIPVICEQIGTYGNASPAQITVCVTQSFGVLTVSNANPVLGSDREDRLLYIARCRLQSAAASPNGPADAYRYASTTGADGLPLQLGDGSGATTVNRVQVTESSSTGRVDIYLANPSGPATSAEVTSANGNIWGIVIVNTDGVVYNPHPIGVVPDTVSLGPSSNDPITGAPGPAAATATPLGPMFGTARIKAVPGLATQALITAAQTAIEDAWSTFFASPESAPIGGLDQVSGAGFIYTADIQAAADASYAGLYALAVTNVKLGGGSASAIALGHVATYRGPPNITAAADDGSGAIKLTVSADILQTNDHIQIYDVTVSGGSGDWLSGNWTVTRLDTTHVKLNGSTFPGGGVFTAGKISSMQITVT